MKDRPSRIRVFDDTKLVGDEIEDLKFESGAGMTVTVTRPSNTRRARVLITNSGGGAPGGPAGGDLSGTYPNPDVVDDSHNHGAGTAPGAAHPNLATHDALGLATDAELATHAAAPDPHPLYALDTDLTRYAPSSHGHPFFEGDDPEIVFPIPGTPGAAGGPGPQGPIGQAVFGEDGDDGWSIPGPRGLVGPAGPAVPGYDGVEGDEGPQGWPGPPGATVTGPTGPQGPPGQAVFGEDGDDGWPGPPNGDLPAHIAAADPHTVYGALAQNEIVTGAWRFSSASGTSFGAGSGAPGSAAIFEFSDNSSARLVQFQREATAAGPEFHFRHALDAAADVLNADVAGRMTGWGHNQGGYTYPAAFVGQIDFVVDGAPGVTYLPGRLDFYVGKSGGPVIPFAIKGTGVVVTGTEDVSGQITQNGSKNVLDTDHTAAVNPHPGYAPASHGHPSHTEEDSDYAWPQGRSQLPITDPSFTYPGGTSTYLRADGTFAGVTASVVELDTVFIDGGTPDAGSVFGYNALDGGTP